MSGGGLQEALAVEDADVTSLRRLVLAEGPLSAECPALHRGRLWRGLLVGSSSAPPCLPTPSEEEETPMPRAELRVLDADIPRTRRELPEFSEEESQRRLQRLLARWCLAHDSRYRQGLNEVLAPFFYLCLQDALVDDRECFVLFDAFVSRFLAGFYIAESRNPLDSPSGSRALASSSSSSAVDGTPLRGPASAEDESTLPMSLQLLQLLLRFHDPQLAREMTDASIGPEIYATGWVVTALSRGTPMSLCLRLWDVVLAVADPAFPLVVCMELLRSKREQLLLSDVGQIPEVISTLGLNDSVVLDAVVAAALRSHSSTPDGLLGPIRAMCSDAEFHVAGAAQRPTPSEPRWTKAAIEQLCSSQLILISPAEVVRSLRGEGKIRWLILDLRTAAELEVCGGGQVAKSLTVSPELLQAPAALEKWLQHLDSSKGTAVCLMDSPPVDIPVGEGLWRRLILGEADGWEAGLDFSPARQLAQVMASMDFPFVGVLDGYFQDLETEVLAQNKGILEPLIIGAKPSSSPDGPEVAMPLPGMDTGSEAIGQHGWQVRNAEAAVEQAAVLAKWRPALVRAEAEGHRAVARELRLRLHLEEQTPAGQRAQEGNIPPHSGGCSKPDLERRILSTASRRGHATVAAVLAARHGGLNQLAKQEKLTAGSGVRRGGHHEGATHLLGQEPLVCWNETLGAVKTLMTQADQWMENLLDDPATSGGTGVSRAAFSDQSGAFK
uniref:Rab-GAP TBC domain-containing protein n=1 Tax=Rhizochromulina marina TaxID=1034831 RepID=A0A7S2S0T3_9STRA|mmetsp:Transcript_23080/g.67208  ORF Transcript_23080/g.67208 Transcript_23080/m.67208 type:complete len:725 (+) Transcript_23080:62-2236(+)